MEAPKTFQDKLNRRFGTTLDNRPKLKIVHGTERDHRGNIKYVNPMTNRAWECWILVRHAPAEFFGTPETWEEKFYDDVHQITVERPFPYRGDYIFICPLTIDGSRLDFNENLFQSICAKLRADEAFHQMNAEQRQDEVFRLDREREAREQKASEEISNTRDEYYRSNWDRINKGATRGYSVTPR